MGMLDAFRVSADTIKTARESKSSFKDLPPGDNYAGRLVGFELQPNKDDPSNLEAASLRFTFKVEIAPSAPEFVGRLHFVRQNLKPNADGKSIGFELLGKLYKMYTGSAIEFNDESDVETALQCVKEKAESQTAVHKFKVGKPSDKINPNTGEPYQGFTNIGALTAL